MAVLQNPLFGTITGSVGGVTYRSRLSQNTITRKAINNTLVGVKTMDRTELEGLAHRTGYSLDDLQKIQNKQKGLKGAVDQCKRENLSDEKYNPSKPGETRFNRCVGVQLSAA